MTTAPPPDSATTPQRRAGLASGPTLLQNPAALRAWVQSAALAPFDEAAVTRGLAAFCKRGFDDFPRPGHGNTLLRWQLLAEVSSIDLCFAKIIEAHTDALAILADLAIDVPAGALLGVWASEPPDARLRFSAGAGDICWIDGRKSWCSGAWSLTHALATGWDAQGNPSMAMVPLQQPGIRLTRDGWTAVGMAATQSVDVFFDHAEGRRIGASGQYLSRPGFWHGAIGIAACWYGASVGLVETLRAQISNRADPFGHANLGAVDVALSAARASLREAAAIIDDAPEDPHTALAFRTRAVVENAAVTTMNLCGRTLGATPFCRDLSFARRMADLPVFLRQNHAEHDLAELAKWILRAEPNAWAL